MRYFKNCTVAIACVAVLVYLSIGIHYASYSPHRSNAYLWGVYHVHSTMSDGLQSPEEIAQQARASGIRLVLLTDHGSPNQASSSFHEIIDGVTIVGGSEANLPDGRLTFFGAQKIPQFRLSSFPPAAIDDAQEWGAFPVLTGYFASAHTLRGEAIAAAAFAFLTSYAQRVLSTPVRSRTRGRSRR